MPLLPLLIAACLILVYAALIEKFALRMVGAKSIRVLIANRTSLIAEAVHGTKRETVDNRRLVAHGVCHALRTRRTVGVEIATRCNGFAERIEWTLSQIVS